MHSALIVEDLPTTRTWLAETLCEAFGQLAITEAGSVGDALACVQPGAFDIALVDLQLPDGDGVRVVKALARLQPQPMVVVASVYADDQHLFPALQAGAQGYVLKDESREDLVRTLRGIRNGQPPLSPAIARRLLGYFQSPFVREAALSKRESETLTLLARGLKLGDIADALGVTRNTASEYIKSVYRKLDVSSRAEAAIRASHLGLVDKEARNEGAPPPRAPLKLVEMPSDYFFGITRVSFPLPLIVAPVAFTFTEHGPLPSVATVPAWMLRVTVDWHFTVTSCAFESLLCSFTSAIAGAAKSESSAASTAVDGRMVVPPS